MATSEWPAEILLDMIFPIMAGWEGARRLKANPYANGISVLGLSAHAMTPDRDQAIAAICLKLTTHRPTVLSFNHIQDKVLQVSKRGVRFPLGEIEDTCFT